MRQLAFVAVGVLGFSASAVAQDRTIPAGAFDGVRPQIEVRGSDAGPFSLYEGRSVAVQPVVTLRANRPFHHR